MDNTSKDNDGKYLPVCRELLKLKKIETSGPEEIEAFIGEADISGYFEHMTNYIASLWENRNQHVKEFPKEKKTDTDPDQDDLKPEKNGPEQDDTRIKCGIKSLDKNDQRLKRQNRGFSSYQELFNVDEQITSSGYKKESSDQKSTKKTQPEQVTEKIEPGQLTEQKSPEQQEDILAQHKTSIISSSITTPEPEALEQDNRKDGSSHKNLEQREESTITQPESCQQKENLTMPIPLNTDDQSSDAYEKSSYTPFDFRLPNATVGRSYCSGLTVTSRDTSISPHNIEILRIDGLESTGLKFETVDPEGKVADGEFISKDAKEKSVAYMVKGDPEKSGEIGIDIFFRLKNSAKQYTAKSVFIINPDPRSLWKNIPSDKKLPFWKPDEDRSNIKADESWKMVGASKRGRSHAHEGKCRDDHFMISCLSGTKWHILAVADGAGSASLSREGARIAATESVKVLSEKLEAFDHEIIDALSMMQDSRHSLPDRSSSAEDVGKSDNHDNNAVNRLKDTLYKVFSLAVYEPVKVIHETVKYQNSISSGQSELKFRDFHTTLILAAHKEINGRQFVASYWIGDGGIGLYHEENSIKIMGEGDSGEFAGQTRFLDNSAITQEDIYKRICFEYQENMTALLLMTDGITDPVFETDQKLNSLAVWDRVWKEQLGQKIVKEPEKTEENLLEWLDFWSQGNHDDRTVALLYR